MVGNTDSRHAARAPVGATKRGLVSTLAALTVAAQLASLAHLALVEHSTCPEHGELIHGDHGDHHAPAAESELSEHSALSARAPAETDADDHCDVLGHRREFVDPPVFSALLAARVTREPAPRALPTLAQRPTLELYSLAPKTSPPAV